MMNMYLLTVVYNNKSDNSKDCIKYIDRCYSKILQKNHRNLDKSVIIKRYEVSRSNNYLHIHVYISCSNKWYFNVVKPHKSLQIHYKCVTSNDPTVMIQTETDMIEYVTKMDNSECPGLDSQTVKIYYDYFREEFISPIEHPSILQPMP